MGVAVFVCPCFLRVLFFSYAIIWGKTFFFWGSSISGFFCYYRIAAAVSKNLSLLIQEIMGILTKIWMAIIALIDSTTGKVAVPPASRFLSTLYVLIGSGFDSLCNSYFFRSGLIVMIYAFT